MESGGLTKNRLGYGETCIASFLAQYALASAPVLGAYQENILQMLRDSTLKAQLENVIHSQNCTACLSSSVTKSQRQQPELAAIVDELASLKKLFIY